MTTFEHVPSVLAARHTLLEGPCLTPQGLAYCDVISGGVFRIAADGTRRTLLERRRGIGGLAVTHCGGLVVTGRDVAVLDANGKLTTWHADPTAAGFNDLAVRRDGSVAVGVLRYHPMAGEAPIPGQVIVLTGHATTVLVEDVVWPNGIAEAQDGTLLVSDFARAHIKRVLPRGDIDILHEVRDGSCDGVALDDEGALWVATGHGGRLHRVAPDGQLLADLDVPAGFVSSVCLDDRWLYVTTADNPLQPKTGGSLLRTRVDVPGAPLPKAITP